jgi:hypothetical protein
LSERKWASASLKCYPDRLLDDRIRLATRANQFAAELLPEPEDQWAEFKVQDSNIVIALKCINDPLSIPLEAPSIDQSWQGLAGDSKRVIFKEGSRFEQRVRDLQANHPGRVQVTENKGNYTPLDHDGLIRSAIRDGLRVASGPIEIAVLSDRIGLQPSIVSEALESMPDVREVFELSRDGNFRTGLITL